MTGVAPSNRPMAGLPRWRRRLANARERLDWILKGSKTKARERLHYAFTVRHSLAPPARIDVAATPDQLDRLVARVEETWRRFGETDPHWSVLTAPEFQKDRIEETEARFYATSDWPLRRVEAALRRHGAALETLGHVLDYGCGVGRVTGAFAARCATVTGADISPAHLAVAQDHCRRQRLENAAFRRIERLDDIAALPEADLVFSVIVLQHNPPPVMAAILERLAGRVAEGGYLWVQCPTYGTSYSYALEDDLAGHPGTMEMHVLPQAAVYRILGEAGLALLEVQLDDHVGRSDWESHSFLARRPRGPGSPPAPGDRTSRRMP